MHRDDRAVRRRPYGAQLLSELGAQVVRIEAPALGGDNSRGLGPYFLGDGDSRFFQTFSRGKQSVALELKTPGLDEHAGRDGDPHNRPPRSAGRRSGEWGTTSG